MELESFRTYQLYIKCMGSLFFTLTKQTKSDVEYLLSGMESKRGLYEAKGYVIPFEHIMFIKVEKEKVKQ